MTAALGRMAAAQRLTAAALLVLALGGAGGMFYVGRAISDLTAKSHPDAEEERRRLHAQLRTDEVIEKLLAGVMRDIDADRVIVYLAHNGKTDLSGLVPFMFLSAVHVHMRPGLAWHERWSRPMPLSVFTPALRRMVAEGAGGEPTACLDYDVDAAGTGAVARARMLDRGSELTFVCPLLSADGRAVVIGLVAVDYLHREQRRPADPEVMGAVRAVAVKVHAAMVDGGAH